MTADPWELFTDIDSFRNYAGVEESEEAQAALQGYIDKGYITTYDSIDACVAALGAFPILS